MSRTLNIQQKAVILDEVKRNISLGYEKPYKISTDTYFKCMELNDHETYHDNVENYLQELMWREHFQQGWE